MVIARFPGRGDGFVQAYGQVFASRAATRGGQDQRAATEGSETASQPGEGCSRLSLVLVIVLQIDGVRGEGHGLVLDRCREPSYTQTVTGAFARPRSP